MIAASDLVPEECYFGLFYHDKDLRIPDIQTLIYIGKNLYSEDEETGRDSWFFQDPESFLKHGPAIKKPLHPECKIHRFDSESLFSVYDWKGLIDELSENRDAQTKGEAFN